MAKAVIVSFVRKEGATGGLGQANVVRPHLINGASEVAIVLSTGADAHIMADPQEVEAYERFVASIPGARLSEITEEGDPGEKPKRFYANKLNLRSVKVVAR